MSKSIQERREELGFTYEDTAELAEISVPFIERCEKIGFPLEPGTTRGETLAARFCEALDITRDELRLDYVPHPAKPDFSKKRYSKDYTGAMEKLYDALGGSLGEWPEGQTVRERAGVILREQGRI